MALATLAGFGPGALALDPPNMPTPSAFSVVGTGEVLANVPRGDATYIGENFDELAAITGAFARLDSTTAKRIAPLAQADDGEVRASAPDGSGGFYIGGTFTRLGGEPRAKIGHILADGSVDPKFNPGVSGQGGAVNALAVSGNGRTLYLGGSFASIGGQPRNNLAAVEAATGSVTSFNPAGLGTDGPVFALEVSGTQVYVGGEFSQLGGQTRNGLAKVAGTTGGDLGWVPNPTLSGNPGKTPGDRGCEQLRLCWWPLQQYRRARRASTSLSSRPRAAMWSGGSHRIRTTLCSRSCSRARPCMRRRLLLHRRPVPSGRRAHGCDNRQRHVLRRRRLSLQGPRPGCFRPGSSTSAASFSNSAIRLPGTTSWSRPTPIPAFKTRRSTPASGPGLVKTLAVDGASVYVGGDISFVNKVTRHGIAALDADGVPTPFNPDAGPDGSVHAIAVRDNDIYLGGNFTSMSGRPRNRIAKVSKEGTLDKNFDPNATGGDSPRVETIIVTSTDVYVGGDFSRLAVSRAWISRSSTRLRAKSTGGGNPSTQIPSTLEPAEHRLCSWSSSSGTPTPSP